MLNFSGKANISTHSLGEDDTANSYSYAPGHTDRHIISTTSCVKMTLVPPIKKLRIIFRVPIKIGHFQLEKYDNFIKIIPFKNGSLCVRALRCHQGNSYIVLNLLMTHTQLGFSSFLSRLCFDDTLYLLSFL